MRGRKSWPGFERERKIGRKRGVWKERERGREMVGHILMC